MSKCNICKKVGFLRVLSLIGGLLLAGLVLSGVAARADSLNIITVNNADMMVMRKLAPQWEKETGNKINWVVLEENALRQRITADLAMGGGQFDIVTLGSYETAIWGDRGWLKPLDDFGADYDYADLIDTVRDSLTVHDKLYAAPFYAEASFTLYRKDLFEKAGLSMPAHPTYQQIAQFAEKLTDKQNGLYGICLRGKPAWGENMAFISTLVNAEGGAWFNMQWQPLLTSDAWKKSIGLYVELMRRFGPPGAASNGFNENQALFMTGHCGLWVDSTVSAARVLDPQASQVADKTGFANAPTGAVPNGASWLWSWALAVPSTTHKEKLAKDFVKWATSKRYIELVAKTNGWAEVPAGTRKSTYENAAYRKAAPFGAMVLKAIEAADTDHPSALETPYTGIQFVNIPEYQAIGTRVGQSISNAVAGRTSVDEALENSQTEVMRIMRRSAYLK